MPLNNYSKAQTKLLKGPQIVSNTGIFDTITVNTLNIDNINSIFSNVYIQDSHIYNTPVGINGPSLGYFTQITIGNGAIFDGSDMNSYVIWDPNNNIFNINGTLEVNGCSYFDNIEICVNTISSTNTNGNIILQPNGVGVVNVIGGITNISSTGSFYSNMGLGGFYVNTFSDITIGSTKKDISITSFLDNNIKSVHGDINISSEYNITSGNIITSIFLNNITNSYQVICVNPHNLLIGDRISITKTGLTNVIGNVNSIINENSFTFLSLNLVNATYISGYVYKISDKNINLNSNNNINLNALNSINILNNVPLNFGSTSSNIYNDVNSGSLNIFNTIGSINITSYEYDINSNNVITTCDNYIITGNTRNSTILINTQNVNITEPIINIAYLNNTNEDKGIEYNYNNTDLGWFGVKTNTNRFTYYSSATNSNNIITGILGDLEVNDLYTNNIYANNIINVGDIDLACHSLLNAKIISGCSNTITLTASNILLSAVDDITIPYNTLLSFGQIGTINICGDTIGNLNLNTPNTVVVNGNLQVNGTTTNVYSTITNIQDPIISIGGVTGPLVNDAKDRGIEFKWARSGTSKTGFFGYQNSSDKFVFIPDGINIYEVFYGSFGNVQFGDGFFDNLDLNNTTQGTITGVYNISSNNLTLSNNQLNLDSNNGIYINNNTSIYYTLDNSVYTVLDTSGNFNINNVSGSIVLSSQNINIPTQIPINFGSTSENIYGENSILYLNGLRGINLSSDNINIDGNTYLNGNLNYSVERYTLNSSLQYQNPSTNVSVTFISVNGVSFDASGTLGTSNVSDGQVKTILCSSMGLNCTYTIYVGLGKIIAPNPGNNTQASILQFNRAGQSVQMIYDSILSSWLILGRGCAVY
jgi:hypothetical protein